MPEFRAKATVSVAQFIFLAALASPLARAAAGGQFRTSPRARRISRSTSSVSRRSSRSCLVPSRSRTLRRAGSWSFSPANALDEMLDGTGLRYSFVNQQTVAITASEQRPEGESEIPGGGRYRPSSGHNRHT